jgi:hypothetical protein
MLSLTCCSYERSMTTLRIYDYRNRVLALDLHDLIDLLAPRSLKADWTISPITLNVPHLGRSFDEFMVVGPDEPSHDELERLAASRSVVSGVTLSKAAHAIRQVIWGKFTATLPDEKDPWVVICAIDSTFYEVTSADEAVLNTIRSAYTDVRVASGPVISVPIEQV